MRTMGAGEASLHSVGRPRRSIVGAVDNDVSIILYKQMASSIMPGPGSPNRVVARVVDDQITVPLHDANASGFPIGIGGPERPRISVSIEHQVAVTLIHKCVPSICGGDCLVWIKHFTRPHVITLCDRGRDCHSPLRRLAIIYRGALPDVSRNADMVTRKGIAPDETL